MSTPHVAVVGEGKGPANPPPQRNRWELILVSALILGAGVLFWWGTVPPTLPTGDVIARVYADAVRYHGMYVRWTAVDWLFTFLSAGTAVGAAFKNMRSVTAEKSDLSNFDIALAVLAIGTVLGTTFEGKIHAASLAERYRAGDLLLQDAQMVYENSQKQPADTAALVGEWLKAQRILEQAQSPSANEVGKGQGTGTVTGDKPPAAGTAGQKAAPASGQTKDTGQQGTQAH